MKKIPTGPVLVMLIGPSGGGKSTLIEKHFQKREVISLDELRDWLTGEVARQDMNDEVVNECYRRIRLRLGYGLRTVVDGTNIRDGDRTQTAEVAVEMGLPVIYLVVNRSVAAKHNSAGWRDGVLTEKGTKLIDMHETTFVANERKILAGDGLADLVIDTRKDEFEVVNMLPRCTTAVPCAALDEIVRRGHNGITTIADVHGNLAGFEAAVKHARNKGNFMLFLGDIVDYGKDSLRVAERVNALMALGEAASIMGNHEKKILRILLALRTEKGFNGQMSPGNEVTINQVKALSESKRQEWENMFIGMCAMMPHHMILGDFMFVHGAATIRMWDMTTFRFARNTMEESFSMFGQTTGKFVDGFPERIYEWVDLIPPRKTVVVGHDIRSRETPLTVVGNAGGTAVFLDTGSAKDGHLSWMDLEIEQFGKKTERAFRLTNPAFGRE